MNAVVKTRSGEIRGCATDGVISFKGIPYAAPPVGANRLLPPQPVMPWAGVRDTLTFGPKSCQLPYPMQMDILPPELVASGEDCLTLNIWTPDLESAGLPVMVWIPGGMFEYHATGASPWYDGSRFAQDGIICVTINYRVGADGFLYLGPGNANRGLLDQVAALEWVRDNITQFGGDPDNVTIFGESAGAMSVGTLLAMPCAKGLFRRAIAQSGAGHHASTVMTGRRVAQRLAEQLGIEVTREAIAALPVECVLAGQAELSAELAMHPDPECWGSEVVFSMMLWQPVIDGDILPARPIDCITAGASAGVDLLIGTNLDENRLFLVPGGMIDHVSEEMLAGAVAGYGLPVERTLAFYQSRYPNACAGDLLVAIQTDWYWRIPAIRLADAHTTRNSATYMYEFAWRSPQYAGRLGACHVLEVPFVFDMLGNRTEPLWGTEPPQALADIMHAAWVTFATGGNCDWPRYDLSCKVTMRFNTSSEILCDPRSTELDLWEGVR